MASITAVNTAADGNRGSTGDALTITGSGFTAVGSTVRVNFAATSETIVVNGTVATATTVTTTVPILAGAGVYRVSVTIPSTNSSTNSLTFYDIAAPVCDSLSVTTGIVTPTTPTNITGTGFAGATATDVSFGTGNPGTTGFSVTGDTLITCIPPTGGTFATATETVDVTVTNLGGTSPVTSNAQFTYYNPPAPTLANPATSAAVDLPRSVDVTGNFLGEASGVEFFLTGTTTGGTPGTDLVPIGDGEILITAPALAAGTYWIAVTTPGGTNVEAGSATLTVT